MLTVLFYGFQGRQANISREPECFYLNDQFTNFVTRYKLRHPQGSVLTYDLIEESLPNGIAAGEMIALIEWAFAQWREAAPGVPQVRQEEGAWSKVRFARLDGQNLALTPISFTGYKIAWREMIIDQVPFSGRAVSYALYLPTIILHEVGHILGLGHLKSSSQPQVMEFDLGIGERRTELGECDRIAIRELYGKQDKAGR